MKTLVGLAVATALAIAAPAAEAQDKTLAIVVKGLDNPFFEQINKGCQKWNAENKGKGYTCLYTGPASSTDEAGEVQIVDDLLTKGVAAIAISPSNAPLMANLLKKKMPKIPVMSTMPRNSPNANPNGSTGISRASSRRRCERPDVTAIDHATAASPRTKAAVGIQRSTARPPK